MNELSPRKGHEGKVPRWLYKSRGARTRGIIIGPYNCPICGSKGLVINVDKKNETALAKCSCGFSRDFIFRSAFQPVDYYGKLIDEYYNKLKPARALKSKRKLIQNKKSEKMSDFI